MPDLPPIDVLLERQRQSAAFAALVEDAWWIMLMIGTGLFVALAVAAVILAICRRSERPWRATPPPTSIIPPRPDGRSRYTAKQRQ